jgi:hypothetical protein
MNTSFGNIREQGQRLIIEKPFIGLIPAIGGMALAELIVPDNLPPTIEAALIIGSSVLAHRSAHKFFGTEPVYSGRSRGRFPLGFRISE